MRTRAPGHRPRYTIRLSDGTVIAERDTERQAELVVVHLAIRHGTVEVVDEFNGAVIRRATVKA